MSRESRCCERAEEELTRIMLADMPWSSETMAVGEVTRREEMMTAQGRQQAKTLASSERTHRHGSWP